MARSRHAPAAGRSCEHEDTFGSYCCKPEYTRRRTATASTSITAAGSVPRFESRSRPQGDLTDDPDPTYDPKALGLMIVRGTFVSAVVHGVPSSAVGDSSPTVPDRSDDGWKPRRSTGARERDDTMNTELNRRRRLRARPTSSSDCARSAPRVVRRSRTCPRSASFASRLPSVDGGVHA